MLEDKSVRVILNSDVIKEIEPLPKNAELEKVYSSIDPLLKNIMCILWSNNVITRYSCEGHEENEEGYIYMDFDMTAFNALSKVMFQIDKIIRLKYKMEDNGDRVLYYPYMIIERCARKVEDDYSEDELVVRFKFGPLNVVTKDEFYHLLGDLLFQAFVAEVEDMKNRIISLSTLVDMGRIWVETNNA